MADDPVAEGDHRTPQETPDDSLKRDVSDAPNGDHKANVEGDEAPLVGKTFKSYEEACYSYKQYAQRTGFGAIVRNSLFTKQGECNKLVLACSSCGKSRGKVPSSRKTGCPALIKLKLHGDGLLHLEKVALEHNHTFNPSRTENCFKKLSSGKVTRPNRSCHAGENEKLSFVDECNGSSERGYMKLRPGEDEAINHFFTRMQTKNWNFFHLVDHDEEGRMRTVFWADSRSRVAYQYFGDVVSFDSTCLMNKCVVPLVLFVGVNHHGQSVLLGCGLVSDETTETYIWLFKAWLACMLGRPPNAVITDQCRAIQDAVAQVFPGARHRLCLWYITKKMPEKLREVSDKEEIKKTFKKAAYDSLRAEDFEKDWRNMIEKYGLEHLEWFNLLYENRHSWALVFLKDTFWAGLCDIQRCQNMAAFFDGFVQLETSLRRFVSMYEVALQSKYEKEAQADHESFHRSRPSISKFYMEEQLSGLYTYNMFRKFQDELKATMYCDVSLVKVDGSISTFEVKESVFLEDGKETENKKLEVLYNADEVEVQCICGSFQFRGILCRHALSVFKLQQVYEIPSQYIISRWRKDYKRLHALARSSNDVLGNNLTERYDYLSTRCLRLVDVGTISDEKYQLALKLIGEVEKHLLDDLTPGDVQQKSMPSGSRLNENNENLGLIQFGISNGDKVPDSSQVKRRGRPPKKRKESDAETRNGSDTLMDSPETVLAGNQSDVVRVATHLGRHIGTQGGIDLMEDMNPNDLSFGGNFDVHANDQDHIGSPLGIQFSNMGQFDQQTIGNHSIRWFYQQTPQQDQLTKAPPGRRNGY